jgi:hypothetical protein
VTAPQIIALNLDPGSDTGIPGDQNTNQLQPRFNGQIRNPFPGAVGGLTVAIQYIQLHPFGLDLAVGPGGRGFIGNPDQLVTTDAQGRFTFQPPVPLRDGFHRLRVVVTGQSDAPPAAGPLDVAGPLLPGRHDPAPGRRQLAAGGLPHPEPGGPLAERGRPGLAGRPRRRPGRPDAAVVPGAGPGDGLQYQQLLAVQPGADRTFLTPDDRDFSNFITSATFVPTTARNLPGDPYTGRIDLTFATGLPPGRYLLVARTQMPGFAGITDAAANPLDQQPDVPGNQSFGLSFDLQPQAAFITGFVAGSPNLADPNGLPVATGPRAFYEVPIPGNVPRAPAPPRAFAIDFSNPLAPRDYTGAVQLIRSANSPLTPADGDFGPEGLGLNGAGTQVPVTVTLTNSIPGATAGQVGFINRLLVLVNSGADLPPDHYRLYIPNGSPFASGTEIFDLFGNQLDGEFLGNPTASGAFEDFLPDGTFRAGLSGDGVGGGAFTTASPSCPTATSCTPGPTTSTTRSSRRTTPTAAWPGRTRRWRRSRRRTS